MKPKNRMFRRGQILCQDDYSGSQEPLQTKDRTVVNGCSTLAKRPTSPEISLKKVATVFSAQCLLGGNENENDRCDGYSL
jgi:hypothetical protein